MRHPLIAVLLPLAAAPLAQAQSGPRPPRPELPDVSTERQPVTPRALPGDLARTPRVASDRPGAARATSETSVLPPLHVRDRVLVDDGGEGEVWARGRTYKAHFDGDAFEYIPFLGSEAPRNRPVRLRLEGVHADGAPVALGTRPWSARDGRVARSRGPVEEAYLLALDSVEQTFVLPAPLGGPVTFEVAVETDLAFEPRATGAAYRTDIGAVRIGGAVAVDAAGERFPLATEHRADGYTIELPAAVAAAARYPLTVDPLVTTFDVDTFGAALEEPKVTTHWASGTSYVVYTENFSSADSDVYYSTISATNTVANVDYVDISAERWYSADVGCAQADGVVLFAAATDAGHGVNSAVRGRRLDVTAGVLEPAFRIDSGNNLGPMSHVSVGGDPLDTFLVTWEREFTPTDRDVFARIVASGGFPLGTGNITLDNSAADYRAPDCSGFSGATNPNTASWAVTAMRDVGGTWTIEAAEIRWDGTVTHGFFPIYQDLQDGLFPLVSSSLEWAGPKTYMAVFRRDYGTDWDIQAVTFRDGVVLRSNNLSVGELPGTHHDDELPGAIETNGDRFTLLWRDLGPGLSYVTTIAPLEFTDCAEEHAVIAGVGVSASNGIAPRQNPADPGDADLILVFEDENDTPTSIGASVYDDYYACVGTGYCPTDVNIIGQEGLLYGSGLGIAGTDLELHAAALPPNQFGMFIAGRANGVVPNPGGGRGNLCLSGATIGRYQTQIRNSGPVGFFSLLIDTNAIPQGSVTVPALPGETWFFQAWYRDVDPITLLATSNFTRGLRVQFL